MGAWLGIDVAREKREEEAANGMERLLIIGMREGRIRCCALISAEGIKANGWK